MLCQSELFASPTARRFDAVHGTLCTNRTRSLVMPVSCANAERRQPVGRPKFVKFQTDQQKTPPAIALAGWKNLNNSKRLPTAAQSARGQSFRAITPSAFEIEYD